MDISVSSTAIQTENLAWDLSTADNPGFAVPVRVDVSTFTAGTHYPNGYFPSGLPVGKIDALSVNGAVVVGPYDNAATDGRQTCLGLLRAATKVPNPSDTSVDCGAAVLVAFAAVRLSKLPVALDVPGQADLTRLYFVA